MLNKARVFATIAVKDLEAASKFYSDTLGLEETGRNAGGVYFGEGENKFFIYASPSVAGTNKSHIHGFCGR